MKYVLLHIFSFIYCPFVSVIVFLMAFLKGLWGNGFYLWMESDGITIPSNETLGSGEKRYWKDRRFYFWEIFKWKYVSKWWDLNKWHDA